MSTNRKLAAEFVGTLFLLMTVVGSGIMAERLAGGNMALALLGNTLPTGAILAVLITMFGPISGAHFNPAVSVVFMLKKDISSAIAAQYILVQITGGIAGTLVAHMMFELPIWQVSTTVRSGSAQLLAEMVATFGLIATILATLAARASAVAWTVGLYITAAYWFTASTSFANPAVTIARALTDTFAGIRPTDAPFFIAAQFLGAVLALVFFTWLLRSSSEGSDQSS